MNLLYLLLGLIVATFVIIMLGLGAILGFAWIVDRVMSRGQGGTVTPVAKVTVTDDQTTTTDDTTSDDYDRAMLYSHGSFKEATERGLL